MGEFQMDTCNTLFDAWKLCKKNTNETNGQINSVDEENNAVEEGVQLKNHQD
jgi:hypothetical protein